MRNAQAGQHIKGNLFIPDPWLVENHPDLYLPMGITAENVAQEYGITREQMDVMAVESHRKAAQAREQGLFKREIIPVTGENSEGNPCVVSEDEGIRPGTSMETLAGLKPCFLEDGQVTAATSSQTSDSAAFVVMMSAEKARELGIKPVNSGGSQRRHTVGHSGLPGISARMVELYCYLGTPAVHLLDKDLPRLNIAVVFQTDKAQSHSPFWRKSAAAHRN